MNPASWQDEDRLIAAMRAVLAVALLIIAVIDPPDTAQSPVFIYAALVLYGVYSLAVYLLVRHQKPILAAVIARGYWLDIIWYSLLIALSRGSSSMFFSGMYFCIITAAFRWGFRTGLKLAVTCAVSFAVISCGASLAEGSDVELNRLLLRCVWLLVLGYILAYWGESEILHKRRLALLKDVTTLANPCFGIDRTLGKSLERLRAFYGARTCILITAESTTDPFSLRRADGRDPERAMNAEELPPELAQRLLSLPPNLAVVYYGRAPIRWHARATYYAWDVSAGEVKVSNLDQLDDLASALDADSFVTLPVRSRDAATGRLYLTGPRRIFRESDVAFLLHILDQLMPVLQNIRLIERLAKHAAEEERLRIARDIHDSVVQPYIGLQLGIAALGETAGSGIPGIKPQIDRLMEMTRSGIADLRRYIRGLEEGTERECSLKLAICRFADRFTEATGIDVQVEAEDEIPVQDRLVAEAFQIVTEGLANIRRHTEARHAVVRVACRSGKLMLEIENDGATGLDAVRFVPHTIQGRAEALGGEVRVERREPARICVMVSIPL